MNNALPFPEISSAFTVDDIRKIRTWNHERYKTMTPQEICEDTHKKAEHFLALITKTTTV